MSDTVPSDSDLLLAFEMAPVGLLVSRQRVVQSCNRAFSDMFGYALDALPGMSLECLYPSADEFLHIGERAFSSMRDTGVYSDDRIMRKFSSELFWCHVSGRATNQADPFASAVWVFEDISARRRVSAELTARERQIAQLLVTGMPNKQIARELHISHRTVEAHRARLLQKFNVASTSELIARLVGRH